MFETTQEYLWGDGLFITSPGFFLILVGPSLYLFVVSIFRNWRDDDESNRDPDDQAGL